MEIYVKKIFTAYFLFLVFSNDFILYIFILPVSQLHTQQLMTSQIRSHTVFKIQT